MQNLVDATISEADMQAIIDAVEMIESKLPVLFTRTIEKKVYTGWAASRKAGILMTKAINHGRRHQDILPAAIDIDGLERDCALTHQLYQLESLFQGLLANFRNTRLGVQKEAAGQGLAIYNLLKVAAENGLCEPTPVSDMQPLMPRAGRKGKKKEMAKTMKEQPSLP